MSIASDTNAVTTWKPYVYTGFGFTNGDYGGSNVADRSATAGSVASNYQNAAENSYAAAISGLESLLY